MLRSWRAFGSTLAVVAGLLVARPAAAVDPCCPSDLDGNGAVGQTELAMVLG